MAESAARVDRAIGTTGLSTHTAGIVLRDIENTISWLDTIACSIENISEAWYGSRKIRRDNLNNLTGSLHKLRIALNTAQDAAHQATFDVKPEQDIQRPAEAEVETPAETTKPDTPATNGRKPKATATTQS